VRLWGLVAALLVLAGCGSPPAPPKPQNSEAPEPAPVRRDKPWDDFETKLEKVFENGIEVSTKGHPGDGPAQIYASPWAADALRRLSAGRGVGTSAFRPGALIVLQHPDGTLYVMRKRPLGRLPDTNDWYFALVREGRSVLESGTATGDQVQEACADCHSTMAKASDWVVPPRLR